MALLGGSTDAGHDRAGGDARPPRAQATQRIVRMHDGALWRIDRLLDPMEEDLRMLARSKLGQAILNEDDMPLVNITPEEEAVLRQVLARIDGAGEEASAPADARVN